MSKFFSGKERKVSNSDELNINIKRTQKQIDEILKGIDIKQSMGENSYTHHTGTKNFYVDEVKKYFEGKGFSFQLMPTESVVSYTIRISW